MKLRTFLYILVKCIVITLMYIVTLSSEAQHMYVKILRPSDCKTLVVRYLSNIQYLLSKFYRNDDQFAWDTSWCSSLVANLEGWRNGNVHKVSLPEASSVCS